MIITDIRKKVDNKDWNCFNIIGLFGCGDILNKIWERTPGRFPKNKPVRVVAPKWAKLCIG